MQSEVTPTPLARPEYPSDVLASARLHVAAISAETTLMREAFAEYSTGHGDERELLREIATRAACASAGHAKIDSLRARYLELGGSEREFHEEVWA